MKTLHSWRKYLISFIWLLTACAGETQEGDDIYLGDVEVSASRSSPNTCEYHVDGLSSADLPVALYFAKEQEPKNPGTEAGAFLIYTARNGSYGVMTDIKPGLYKPGSLYVGERDGEGCFCPSPDYLGTKLGFVDRIEMPNSSLAETAVYGMRKEGE